MRVGGKGTLDHLSQLWQLQNSGLAAEKLLGKVDRYKEYMISKDAVEKARTATHQGKRKRSRTNTQAGSAQNLRQGKARADAATPNPTSTRQTGVQSTSPVTTAVPLQPLSKYKQVAESDQTTETENKIVVTA
ncbi:MAG TPA: hypothetical protein VKF36_15470 [Syntrophorhabdales bacterium]|nr:hypothetical protein [Syntrophorhabdales bacterium]